MTTARKLSMLIALMLIALVSAPAATAQSTTDDTVTATYANERDYVIYSLLIADAGSVTTAELMVESLLTDEMLETTYAGIELEVIESATIAPRVARGLDVDTGTVFDIETMLGRGNAFALVDDETVLLVIGFGIDFDVDHYMLWMTDVIDAGRPVMPTGGFELIEDESDDGNFL